jgi:CRISPR-associated endonuclease/helicase Cas3
MAYVHQWFNGRKKNLLADFIVGTIDQLLLMALKQKHVMLRHLGLAGKVIIIDECHAYDAYMSQYLKMALRWLGAYGTPVIVLSATLPIEKRREVIGAYLDNENITGEWTQNLSYPLITYTDGNKVTCLSVKPDGNNVTVAVKRLETERIADNLEELLSGGGCAGVIMDTVRRAQNMARILRERFGADIVQLIHSRFIAADRIDKEKELRGILGKEGIKRPKGSEKLIVVGTQVLEQSLDIDFDVMITDIAPMDLLLQRLGRLHRHNRSRPDKLRNPVCFITGIDEDDFEEGIDRVYHKYLLMRTRDLLDIRDRDVKISLPKDIAPLVNAVYDSNAKQTKEKEDFENKIKEKERAANTFRIRKPLRKPDKTLEDWLSTDVDDNRGEASVRDSHDSIEVLVIKESNHEFHMVNGTKLPKTGLDDELAACLARQRVAFPSMLSRKGTIEELESITKRHVPFWQNSPWLSGELFLILDENNAATLCGRKITYNEQDGLYID